MGSAASVIQQGIEATKRQYIASKTLPKLFVVRTLQRIKSGTWKVEENEKVEEEQKDHIPSDETAEVHNNDGDDQCSDREIAITKEKCGQLALEAAGLIDRGGATRLEQARHLLQQVVEWREKLLGPLHANTLKSYATLGFVLYKEMKFDAARCQYEKAVDGYEQVFGLANRDTLNCMNSLAEILTKLGMAREKEAADVYRKCLRGKEKLYGDHESTFNTANQLADLLKKLKQTEEARDVYSKALKGKQKVLGADHPSTINAIVKVALMCMQTGKIDEAISLYEDGLERQERIFGLNNESTLATAKCLCKLYNMLSVNRREDAIALTERIERCNGENRAGALHVSKHGGAKDGISNANTTKHIS